MKKRNNLFIAGLLLCAVSFYACDKNKDKDPVKNTLSVSGAAGNELFFAAKDNANVTLTVTTDAAEWDFTKPGWVTATKSGNTLVVNVTENTGTGELDGEIKFTAGTADAVTIDVYQAAPEAEGGIAIDGAFTDWADIPVTKTGVGNMTEGKYYSDGTDLFMYFKANKSVITGGWDNLLVFFDSDNNNTSGRPMAYAFGNDANGGGIDYLLELVIASSSEPVNPIGKWSGDPYIVVTADTWGGMTGVDGIKGEANITNCINGMGAVNGNYYELEMQVKIETLPWSVASPFHIGARIGSSDATYIPIYTWTWK